MKLREMFVVMLLVTVAFYINACGVLENDDDDDHSYAHNDYPPSTSPVSETCVYDILKDTNLECKNGEKIRQCCRNDMVGDYEGCYVTVGNQSFQCNSYDECFEAGRLAAEACQIGPKEKNDDDSPPLTSPVSETCIDDILEDTNMECKNGETIRQCCRDDMVGDYSGCHVSVGDLSFPCTSHDECYEAGRLAAEACQIGPKEENDDSSPSTLPVSETCFDDLLEDTNMECKNGETVRQCCRDDMVGDYAGCRVIVGNQTFQCTSHDECYEAGRRAAEACQAGLKDENEEDTLIQPVEETLFREWTRMEDPSITLDFTGYDFSTLFFPTISIDGNIICRCEIIIEGDNVSGEYYRNDCAGEPQYNCSSYDEDVTYHIGSGILTICSDREPECIEYH